MACAVADRIHVQGDLRKILLNAGFVVDLFMYDLNLNTS